VTPVDPSADQGGLLLVTGATGFVGRELCRVLAEQGRSFLPAVRRAGSAAISGQPPCVVGDLDASTDWSALVAQVGTVVHLASRVHVMHESSADPLPL
jgi:nucleoside-diphosphate-sugar epimerase